MKHIDSGWRSAGTDRPFSFLCARCFEWVPEEERHSGECRYKIPSREAETISPDNLPDVQITEEGRVLVLWKRQSE